MVEGPSGDDGLSALVADRSPETAERLDEALAAATSTRRRRCPTRSPRRWRCPTTWPPRPPTPAELKVVLSTEVASVLGVTIGFSDADGDS